MYSTRFQELMTQGYSLATNGTSRNGTNTSSMSGLTSAGAFWLAVNLNHHFPWFPEPTHIEEIVMLLAETSSRISRGQIEYAGVL